MPTGSQWRDVHAWDSPSKTARQDTTTSSCCNKLLLRITRRTGVSATPVSLQWHWKLLQIVTWLFVSGLIIPWSKYLKNFKNKSSKLQRFELFNYKDNFILLAAQSARSNKANPPPPPQHQQTQDLPRNTCQEFYWVRGCQTSRLTRM